MISTTAQGERGLGPAEERGGARGARREILTDVALLALLALFLYLPGIGSRDLQSVDEIRYSEVAREMIASESWLVPILNGETYMEKPALFFWLLSVPALIAGEVTVVGSRLVPVFFSILTLIFTYGIGRVLLGRRGGLWAAAILGTIFSFGSYSQHAVFDIPLTAATTLSLFAYVVWSRTGRHPTAMKVLCYVAMGFGVLLKGPIAILLPGLVMAADTVPRERWKALRTPHLFWGPLLTLGVFLLWFAPAAWSAGPEYLDYMFKRHIVDRSISGSAPHAHSIFYYLHKLIADALPWTPLLLPAAVCAWRALRGDPGRAGGRADAGLRLGSIWCAVMLVTLSPIASKRGRYLLPIYPGVALLLSAWFEAVRARGGIFEGRLEHLMVGATRHALALMVALGVVVLIAWQVAGAFDIDLLAELPDSKEIRHLQGGEAPLYGAIALEGIVLLSIA
ncbi:MAG: ArnT family glycosyltransferase, partial [Planctomycetota bacterium]